MFKELVKNVEAKLNENNLVEFEITGNIDEIEDWEVSCSCTGIKIEGNKLIVGYRNNGSHTFEHRITIFLKDGEPLKSLVNGIMNYNFMKKRIYLHVVGVAK